MTDESRCRTRQEAAVAWAGSHAVELAGVGVPLVAGTLWWPWLDLLSGVAVGLWVANELRLRRTTRTARQAAALTTDPPRPQLSHAAAENSDRGDDATTEDTEGSEPTPAGPTPRREVYR